ncbi:hypothetical protein HPB49_018995 [Dermacentor silvarum]|uniref:Uncharacterized protein n=1 Tax=Dermacentor silvarum TaxID=543639 RepID=A0ACB8CSH3_DERSI|nr:hypothetical protein HPB49_018995 [Dermacentor silvarum]
MVCTMSDRITSRLQFPTDGLCDFIFFDSLYKNGSNMLSDPATYSSSLNIFLNDHRAYRRTTLGVGLAFDNLLAAETDLRKRNPSPLEPFWRQSIFHVGIIDTPSSAIRSQTKAAITTLKGINRLLDTQRVRGNFSITAIAAPNAKADWSVAFAKDFKSLSFTPFLFIVFGHYRFGDNMVPHCAIMPPTRHPDDAPPEDIAKHYDFDLATAVLSLSELYDKGAQTRGHVSVTLKGRWAKPLSPDKATFFQRCESDPDIESFGSYTEVCPGVGAGSRGRLDYSKKHFAMITYIQSLKRTFVYDDEKAFATKLCYTKSLGSHVTFGIAVYDIDYDDYENKCSSVNKYKHNSRLKALKKVVESFRKQDKSFNENVCKKYAAP